MKDVQAGRGVEQRARHGGSAGRSHVAPRAERRTEPLAALGEGGGQVRQARQFGPDRGQHGALSFDELGDSGADRLAEFGRDRIVCSEGDHRLSLDAPLFKRSPRVAPMSEPRLSESRLSEPGPTIAEMLRSGGHPTMSFEFFPPRDDAGQDQLRAAIRALEPLRPDFVSVTYGATGSTRHRTIEATRFIKTESAAQTMGHLTCVQPVDRRGEGCGGGLRRGGGRPHSRRSRGSTGRPDGPVGPTPGGARQRHPTGPAGQGRWATSASASPPSPTRTPSTPTSPWTPGSWPRRSRPVPSSRSPSCSSPPTPTSGWSRGCAHSAANSRSSPASCR